MHLQTAQQHSHNHSSPFVSPTCLLQDTTKNYAPQEAAGQLQQLLRLPWSSGSLQTLSATTNIQISRKGKALLQTQLNPATTTAGSAASLSSCGSSSSRGLAPAAAAAAAAGDGASGGLISLQHDRAKALPINGSIPDPFLQRIGLQTADGRIKASMQVGVTLVCWHCAKDGIVVYPYAGMAWPGNAVILVELVLCI
jgi:hypothetical protein